MEKLWGCLKKKCKHEWVLRCEINSLGFPYTYWYCKKCGEIKIAYYHPLDSTMWFDENGWSKVKESSAK